MKISVIDLGFNSSKLVIYNVKDDDSFDVYIQEGVKTRLGEGLDEKGKLGKKPMSRTIDTLKIFRDTIQLNPIKAVLPIATSAVREAANKEEFLNSVYKETSFNFKVLSEREEALYSYVGAIRSLRIPTVLFFDIGGGSIEMVYAEQFKIKKVLSFPLGALRLTTQFGGKNGQFTAKKYKDMSEYIWNLLPSKKELMMSNDVKLVGVGGALRALARYEQTTSNYPLDKTHNYKISHKSLNTTAKTLSKTKHNQLSQISVIGSSRSETIVAGSCVVNTILDKYGFSDLYVSNHGLREGALSLFLEDSKTYQSGSINNEQIKRTLGFSDSNTSTRENLLNGLFTLNLLSKKEKKIIEYSQKILSEKSSYNNPQSLFYYVMDEDTWLSHIEQLIAGLSLVHARHTKTSEWLLSRYKSILSSQDRQSIRKISSFLTLNNVLERTKSAVELKLHGPKILEINLNQLRSSHKFLLKHALKKFEDIFDIEIILFMRQNEGNSQKSVLKL